MLSVPSILEPTFDDTLVKVFGEKAHAMSLEQKGMLKKLWDTAYGEGKERQLNLEVGGLIEKFFRGMTFDPNTGSMVINMDPETPLEVQQVIQDHAIRKFMLHEEGRLR